MCLTLLFSSLILLFVLVQMLLAGQHQNVKTFLCVPLRFFLFLFIN